MNDIHWAAGFLEGEGTFHCGSNLNCKCAQVQREPLERLATLFGGTIAAVNGRGTRQDHFIWQTWGPRAAGIMMTLYVLMSPRRKGQIEKALDLYRKKPGRLGGRLHKKYLAAKAA